MVNSVWATFTKNAINRYHASGNSSEVYIIISCFHTSIPSMGCHTRGEMLSHAGLKAAPFNMCYFMKYNVNSSLQTHRVSRQDSAWVTVQKKVTSDIFMDPTNFQIPFTPPILYTGLSRGYSLAWLTPLHDIDNKICLRICGHNDWHWDVQVYRRFNMFPSAVMI